MRAMAALLGVLALAGVVMAPAGAQLTPGPNLALGKPYTLSPAPNYEYCTDPGDATQLTDGKYVEGYFWVQRGTVGWSGVDHADIVIDLGSPQPICGCSFSTAAGVAGVTWPALIYILVSDDGKTWCSGGDLVGLSAMRGLPRASGYATHRFGADDLKLHGRYFRLLIGSGGPYTFCDEIEVYQGSPGLMAVEMTRQPAKPEELIANDRVVSRVRTRLLRDIEQFRSEAKQPGLSDVTVAWARTEAEQLTAAAKGPVGPFDATWRAVHPLTPLHARIYAARARLRRESGASNFTVWHQCRWDMLDPMALPAKGAQAPELSVAMLRDEYRSEAINVSNMGEHDSQVLLSVGGLPGEPTPRCLSVHQVEWVETQEGFPVADALPPATRIDRQGWQVTVPAGMTRQVWLTFHSAELRPREYTATLALSRLTTAKRPEAVVPLHLRVYPTRLPEKLSCSLGMWDYTCPGSYDIGPGNVDAAIRNMRSHFLDTPWTDAGCVPWPQGFDDQGNVVGNLDWSRFDGWVADWADATNYGVFLSVGAALGGVEMKDPRFPAGVGAWMHAWVKHLGELGLKPEQLMLLLVDEPSQKDQEEIIANWARAIKAAEPKVCVWEDPTHESPEKAATPAMFDLSDVLCPNLAIFGSGSEQSRQYYADLKQRGKILWFYQCSGPAKTHDPYYYHRLQEWYCFKYGATGSGFWAYGDAAGTGTSWNELRAPRTSYTPVYLEPTSVTDGKHFEAVREGLEDYECLRMVRDRASELEKTGHAQEARRLRGLLKSAIDEVCGAGYDPGKISWTTERDRTVADRWRVQLLEVLSAK